jgi:hypothetical protein
METSKYDSNGDIKQTLTQKMYNNSWENSSIVSYYYNKNRKKTNELYEKWINDAWSGVLFYNFEYDNTGKLLTTIVKKWDNDQWADLAKITDTTFNHYEYGIKTQYWYNEAWSNDEMFSYTIDSSGWFLNCKFEVWANDMWIPDEGEIYILNPDGFELHYIANNMKIYYANPLSVKNGIVKPHSDFELMQNYPNPFNPSTIISYNLREKGWVKISIYDIKGERIATLVNEEKEAGYHEVEFNPARSGKIASGVYICRVDVKNDKNIPVFSGSKKLIYLK